MPRLVLAPVLARALALAFACACVAVGFAPQAGAATISGFAYRGEADATPWQGCDGISPNLRLSVAGAPPVATSCNRITGAYSFTGQSLPTPGEPLIAYLSTSEAEGATYYTVASGGADVTDLDLVQDRVSLESGSPSTSFDRSTLQLYDAVDDPDLPVDATTNSAITLPTTMELHVGDGVEFHTDGALTTGSIHVDAGATLLPAGGDLTVTGSGVEDDCTLGPGRAAPICETPGGDFDNTVGTVDTVFAPTHADRPVALSADFEYRSTWLRNGGEFVIGTRPGQVLESPWYMSMEGDVTSDPWNADVNMGQTTIKGGHTWSGRGEFDITSGVGIHEDGTLDLPKAHLTILGHSPVNRFRHIWAPDWDIGSLDVQSGRWNHDFGTTGGGSDTFDSGGADTPVAMVYDERTEALFVVLNRPNGGTGQDWSILKYTSYWDGIIDTTWGVNGELVVPVAGTDTATGGAMSADGSLLVGGQVGTSWAVKAFDVASGALVSAFDGDGIWTPGITGSVTSMVEVQGTVLVGGNDTASNTWQIRRLDATGSALDSFNWNGDSGSGATPTQLLGMCKVSWEEQVYVVGRVGAAGSRDWAVGFLNHDGTWHWEPYVDAAARPGRIVLPGTEDRANACHDTGDFLYIGGTTGNGAATDTGEVRAFERWSAQPVTWWGTNGAVSFNGTGQDYLTSLTGLRGELLVAGGDSANGGRSVVRRLDMSGTIDATFNHDTGNITWNAGAGAERAVDIQYIGDFVHVLNMKGTGSGDVDVHQYDPTGALLDNWDGGVARHVFDGFGRGKLHVHGDVTVGSGDPDTRTWLDLRTSEQGLVIDGSLNVLSDGYLRASNLFSLSVGGDLDIAGEFRSESGTVLLQPSSKQVDLNVAAATRFHNLTVRSGTGAGLVRMDSVDDIEVTGAFTATGASCAETLRLRPIGAGWTLTNPGSTNASFVDLANATFAPARTVTSSWNAGSNTGVTFSGSCGSAGIPRAPDDLLVNGVRHAQAITDTPAPTFTWTNRTGSNVDTADVSVLSSDPTGVLAHYKFDSGSYLVDSSGNGNTLLDIASTQGTGKFGASASTDTTQWGVRAPNFALSTDFSVDGWFRRGPLTPSDDAFPIMATRASGAPPDPYTFALMFDRDANRIGGFITKNNAADLYRIDTDATQYTDNQWHHVAFTYEDSQLRLYLDGKLIDFRETGPAATPPDNGAWYTYFGPRVNGDLDDWTVRSVAMSGAEIRGYIKTRRPHLDTVWSTSGSSFTTTGDGAAATFTYGGAAGTLGHDGARYWTRARFRTTPGSVWSAWSRPDWFTTTLAEQTSVALPDGAGTSLGVMSPGMDAHSEFRVRVETASETGWSMFVRGEDDTYALSNGLTGATNQIARRTTPSWPAGTAGFAGLTVLTAPGGKQSPWCGDADPVNYNGQCYAWPTASQAMRVHDYPTYDVSTHDVSFSVRINPASDDRAAIHTGRLEFLVVPNA